MSSSSSSFFFCRSRLTTAKVVSLGADHEPTLFGSLAGCKSIAGWREVVLEAYPPSWLPTLRSWWSAVPPQPLADLKRVLRFRPLTSLTGMLGLTEAEVGTALRRRLPALAKSVSTIFVLAKQSQRPREGGTDAPRLGPSLFFAPITLSIPETGLRQSTGWSRAQYRLWAGFESSQWTIFATGGIVWTV